MCGTTPRLRTSADPSVNPPGPRGGSPWARYGRTMINVLYLHSQSEMSGAEFSLLDTLNFLDRARFSPLVILPARGRLSSALDQKAVPYRIMRLRSLKAKNPFPYLFTVVRLFV